MSTDRQRRIVISALFVSLSAIGAVLASGETRTWSLLGNTALLAIGSCAIAIPVGVVAAILFWRTDLPGGRWFGLLVLLLMFVPLYLQAAGWDAGFGRQGWFSFSRQSLAEPPLQGWPAAIWIHGLAGVPWVVLIVGTALTYVEREFEELAVLEAPALVVLWTVTVQRCLPAIGVSAIWILIATAGEMTVTDLYQVRTYAEEIYSTIPLQDFSTAHQQWRSWVLVVSALTMVSLIAVYRLAPVTRNTRGRALAPFPLRRVAPLAVVFSVLLVIVLAAVPLANLIINAGIVVNDVDGRRIRTWAVEKFLRIVLSSPGRFSEEFAWTFLIASAAATAATGVAVVGGWLAVRRFWAAILAVGVTSVCLATPGPMIGLSIIGLLNRDSELLAWLYDRTVLAPSLAMFVRGLPLALLISWHSLRSISSDMLEAAATDGAGPLQRLAAIAAPQRLAALATAWLAAFAVAMGDLAATILVTPPGVTTIALRVFGMLHAGVDDQVAGLCLSIFGLFMLLGMLVIFLGKVGVGGDASSD